MIWLSTVSTCHMCIIITCQCHIIWAWARLQKVALNLGQIHLVMFDNILLALHKHFPWSCIFHFLLKPRFGLAIHCYYITLHRNHPGWGLLTYLVHHRLYITLYYIVIFNISIISIKLIWKLNVLCCLLQTERLSLHICVKMQRE